MLLSLIPLSCMVASKRKVVNITFQTHISTMSNSNNSKAVSEDINMKTLRGRSPNSSINNFRKSLTHSNVSSILYHIRIEIQSKDLSQAKQIDVIQDFQLSYASSNIEDNNSNNKTNTPSNIQNPYLENVTNCGINIYLPQSFNVSSILYRDKQLALPECWNGQNHPISIFSTSKSLIKDNNNIIKSLLRIVNYVKYNKLIDNNKEDILEITDFGHVA